jgi:hypothetical protein
LIEEPVQPDKFIATDLGINLEFVPDSPEQIQNSVLDIGYRHKLEQGFEAAIAKAKKTI